MLTAGTRTPLGPIDLCYNLVQGIYAWACLSKIVTRISVFCVTLSWATQGYIFFKKAIVSDAPAKKLQGVLKLILS